MDIHLDPIRENFASLKDLALEALMLKYTDPNYEATQPAEITDGRRQDVWDSLFEVADLAGKFWGKRIREAAIKHEQTHTLTEAQPIHMRLLFDAGEALQDETEEWISAEDLTQRLRSLNPEEWNNATLNLTKNKLARFMSQTQIKSEKRRYGGQAGISCYNVANLKEKAALYLSDQAGSDSQNENATETQHEITDELKPSEQMLRFAAGSAVKDADPFAGGWSG